VRQDTYISSIGIRILEGIMMHKDDKDSDTEPEPSQKEFHNSSSITLTYGDGSTAELNNEIMEGTTSDMNDSSFLSETNSNLVESEPIISTAMPTSSNAAKPGRARRRGTESGLHKGTPTTAAPRRRRKRRPKNTSFLSFLTSFLNPQKIKKRSSTSKSNDSNQRHKKKHRVTQIPIYAAIAFWYVLGVVSISTTKVLLTPYLPIMDPHAHNWLSVGKIGGIKPFMLSVQQFCIGVLMLRFILNNRLVGGYGIIPLPKANRTGER